MSKKVTSVFAYLGLIFWLIGFFTGDKEGAKVHLNQGLVLIIASAVCSILSSVPYVGVVAGLVSIVLFVFMIMGIVYACKGEDKELPVIGGIKILK